MNRLPAILAVAALWIGVGLLSVHCGSHAQSQSVSTPEPTPAPATPTPQPLPPLKADLHCDTLSQIRLYGGSLNGSANLQVDLPRLRRAGNNGQVFMTWSTTASIRNGFAWDVILKQIDIFDSYSTGSDDRIALVRTGAELDNVLKSDKTAAVLGLEGAYCLEEDLQRLDVLANRGVRIIGPVWNYNNDFADSATAQKPRWNGLSPLGIELVARCNDRGLLIDAAHASEKTVAAILEQSSDPIIDTHTACKALCNHPRNLSDGQIEAICSRGGVIGILFHSPYLTCGTRHATMEDVLDHLDHLVQVGGIECAAIGSDFDGNIVAAEGLQDISQWPGLLDGLKARGYTDEQIAAIAGGNFARLFRRVCDKW